MISGRVRSWVFARLSLPGPPAAIFAKKKSNQPPRQRPETWPSMFKSLEEKHKRKWGTIFYVKTAWLITLHQCLTSKSTEVSKNQTWNKTKKNCQIWIAIIIFVWCFLHYFPQKKIRTNPTWVAASSGAVDQAMHIWLGEDQAPPWRGFFHPGWNAPGPVQWHVLEAKRLNPRRNAWLGEPESRKPLPICFARFFWVKKIHTHRHKSLENP